MKTQKADPVHEISSRLIEVAGRAAQDLGLGRIPGQVVAYLYLSEGERSMDEIGRDLGLSKAAVSIATRRMETIGLLERAWKPGDRRGYYRTPHHFGVALQRGLLELVRGKVNTIGAELDRAEAQLREVPGSRRDSELHFIRRRLSRARTLRKRAMQILDNPLVRLLGR